jgi:hypothetical protein
MNIFYLSKSIKRCARYHCDKHVVKMILETTQLLYTCLWLCYTDDEWVKNAPLTKSGKHGYKKTHQNHPCAIWVRESLDNYKWLCKFGKYLCKEYTYRYDKIHSCEKHILWLSKTLPDIKSEGLTPIKLAMPEKYKCNNPVKAYRKYYMGEKKDFCKWTKRDKPHWYKFD